MGGYGSGRRGYSTKDTVEECLSLDVNRLQRWGHLIPHRSFSVHWTRNGERSGSIRGSIDPAGTVVTFAYRLTPYGGSPEHVSQPTRLEWTPCRFGGRRPWFRCPRVGCGRRVVKLYQGGLYFLCRRCSHLVYESQNENWGHRALRRTQNIRMRLGGDGSLARPFPPKPKRMHWRTYDRLREQAHLAEMEQLAWLGAWLDRDHPGWRES